MRNQNSIPSGTLCTTVSINVNRRKIAIEYTPHSIQWEPALTALLSQCKGLIQGKRHYYTISFWEQPGRNLDLLSVGRKAQKQLCWLSKHSVYLTLEIIPTLTSAVLPRSILNSTRGDIGPGEKVSVWLWASRIDSFAAYGRTTYGYLESYAGCQYRSNPRGVNSSAT